MTAYLFTNHVLNFLLPAAAVALIFASLSRPMARFLGGKGSGSRSWTVQVGILFVVNVAVLVAGLLVFSQDGKMATYAALVVCAATAQWWLLRGWKA